MARRIAVSFENDTIRVVYASSSRGKLSVQKTLVLRDEEFDAFLEKERARDFTVVCDLAPFFQDILYLPPVNKKYLRSIVGSEIKKRSPETTGFSFFYTVVGEKVQEGRKAKETFVYAVGNDDLHHIIERFSRHGKTVRCLYPSAFTLSRLVQACACVPADEAVLCLAESGMNKILFLIKSGGLYFVRTAQSLESGVHDFDVQNVNMTINYCRQTLRISPSHIILVGPVCYKYEAAMGLIIPALCIDYTANLVADRKTAMEFAIPISALLHTKDAEAGDLLPVPEKNLYLQRVILTWYTALFVFFSIAGLGYIKAHYSGITALKEKSDSLRLEMRQLEPDRLKYESNKRELQELMPSINLMNAANSGPDVQKALIDLSVLASPYKKEVSIRSVELSAEGKEVLLRLKGTIKQAQFSDMQQVYQRFIEAIKKTKSMEIALERLDLKDKGFQIDIKYK